MYQLCARSFNTLFQFLIMTSCQSRNYYSLFINEDTEVHREYMTCPKHGNSFPRRFGSLRTHKSGYLRLKRNWLQLHKLICMLTYSFIQERLRYACHVPDSMLIAVFVSRQGTWESLLRLRKASWMSKMQPGG